MIGRVYKAKMIGQRAKLWPSEILRRNIFFRRARDCKKHFWLHHCPGDSLSAQAGAGLTMGGSMRGIGQGYYNEAAGVVGRKLPDDS
jgi:hypothetical protein